MKNPKILYLSCHSILEYDELRMFRDENFDFFSIGAYITPYTPHNQTRPGLYGCSPIVGADVHYHKMYNENLAQGISDKLAGRIFSSDFLDLFDVIIVMHIPDWIIKNWGVLKGRKVIWRTIGQSTPATENSLKPYREEGLKIVRYSPKEKKIPNYIGEDDLIRFGKYQDDFKPWLGNLAQVITVCQSMLHRASFCNYDLFSEATAPFQTKLYGNGNAGAEIANYSDLLTILSQNAVYFYTGTKPACYTLNFIEAAMAGIPMVSIGTKAAEFEGHDYFEVSDLLRQYQAGHSSDSVDELRIAIQHRLSNRELANQDSLRLRNMAIELFGADTIRKQWVAFFDSL